ncbi:hypothetical protein U9M48_037547 [Paspalum notatum var. saurae]|uniref:Uncharacterized protein n=1 Tax=Paspalum notatum var. saurae TaxID=547442 RepID=A0AAQ3XCI5_PASNO
MIVAMPSQPSASNQLTVLFLCTFLFHQELQEGIAKLNSHFSGAKTQESVALNQDHVGEIGLGRRGRACLLMLLRLNRLAMETVDGPQARYPKTWWKHETLNLNPPPPSNCRSFLCLAWVLKRA